MFSLFTDTTYFEPLSFCFDECAYISHRTELLLHSAGETSVTDFSEDGFLALLDPFPPKASPPEPQRCCGTPETNFSDEVSVPTHCFSPTPCKCGLGNGGWTIPTDIPEFRDFRVYITSRAVTCHEWTCGTKEIPEDDVWYARTHYFLHFIMYMSAAVPHTDLGVHVCVADASNHRVNLTPMAVDRVPNVPMFTARLVRDASKEKTDQCIFAGSSPRFVFEGVGKRKSVRPLFRFYISVFDPETPDEVLWTSKSPPFEIHSKKPVGRVSRFRKSFD